MFCIFGYCDAATESASGKYRSLGLHVEFLNSVVFLLPLLLSPSDLAVSFIYRSGLFSAQSQHKSKHKLIHEVIYLSIRLIEREGYDELMKGYYRNCEHVACAQ